MDGARYLESNRCDTAPSDSLPENEKRSAYISRGISAKRIRLQSEGSSEDQAKYRFYNRRSLIASRIEAFGSVPESGAERKGHE